MTKLKFLLSLNDKLSGLPQGDVEERLNFYSEMIEDRVEDGLSEEDAVAEMGAVEDVAEQIKAEITGIKTETEKIKPKRRLKVWEILIIILGSPIWLSLLIAALAVVLSIYVSLWAVVVSLWAVFASVIVSALGVAIVGVVFICLGHVASGIAMIGVGLVCAGLSIFLFFGCKEATKGTVFLPKWTLKGTKNVLPKRRERNE